MTVVTNNTIQPSSGQSLTIKDEGGTASITVQTDGDLTLAENAYLGSGKGIYFDGQTTSANFLDDYEEGTWTPTGSNLTSAHNGKYIKIGSQVTCIVQVNASGGSGASTIGGLPFTSGANVKGGGGAYATADDESWKLVVEPNTTEIRIYRGFGASGIPQNEYIVCQVTYMTF